MYNIIVVLSMQLQAFLVGERVKSLHVVTSSTHTTPSIFLLGQKTNQQQYLGNNNYGNNFDIMIMILIAFSLFLKSSISINELVTGVITILGRRASA